MRHVHLHAGGFHRGKESRQDCSQRPGSADALEQGLADDRRADRDSRIKQNAKERQEKARLFL